MIHGLEILLVAPAYSSQTCSECGQLGVRNKHAFSCQCGYRAHSDFNASVNLAAVGTGFSAFPRVPVNVPPSMSSKYRPAQVTGITGTTSSIL